MSDRQVAAPEKRPESPRTAAIIIGRNEGERLIRCLESLQPSGAPMVYVDSASSDGSPEAAAARGALVHDLDLDKPFTAARARNEGVEKLGAFEAQPEYVLFVDGDCEVETGWIDAAVRFLDDHPDIAAVCGRRRERYPEASVYNQLCDHEWNTPIGETAACGGDSLMRTDALTNVGGFDPAMIAGEEPELCHRLRAAGQKIWRLDEPMTVHDADMHHFRQWWLRAIRSGFGYAQVWDTTRKRGNPLYGREIARALFWALALPLLFGLAGLFQPLLWAGLPLAYGLQIMRMAFRSGPGNLFSWQQASLAMAGKFAELMGIVRYAKRKLQGRQGGTIFYK